MEKEARHLGGKRQTSIRHEVTKRKILSRLGSIHDPLCIISPIVVEGKRIYRLRSMPVKSEKRDGILKYQNVLQRNG